MFESLSVEFDWLLKAIICFVVGMIAAKILLALLRLVFVVITAIGASMFYFVQKASHFENRKKRW